MILANIVDSDSIQSTLLSNPNTSHFVDRFAHRTRADMLRRLHTSTRALAELRSNPDYRLKCGLEIHTQLQTKHKLFSLSPTSINAWPNSNVSYFDAGLPGTQPKLNPEAILLALKTAVALNCEIQSHSCFDRKHYFYPDQPLGYQITQHYHPIAKRGKLELNKQFDEVHTPKTIRIEQIQIEQDTGKTTHDDFDHTINIDLNRANTPLIELVTKPDFDTVDQVKAFVKKFQLLVRHIGVCTGDLETGAIRVDVNVSVNGYPRVEIKNLNSHSEILQSIMHEYWRQVELIKQDKSEELQQETRGWDGEKTILLRKKESSVDYRYFPDSELPHVILDPTIGDQIRATLPELPEELLRKLTSMPYNLELRYARHLVEHPYIMKFYFDLFDKMNNTKMVNNWVTQELPAAFSKMNEQWDFNIVSVDRVVEIMQLVASKKLSLTSARHLIYNMIKHKDDGSIGELIVKYDLAPPSELVSSEEINEAINEICEEIVNANEDVVAKIRRGQTKLIKYLVGLAMKETQGKIPAKDFENKFKMLIV